MPDMDELVTRLRQHARLIIADRSRSKEDCCLLLKALGLFTDEEEDL